MVPHHIGYGAGTRDTDEVPNLVRVVAGAPSEAQAAAEAVYLIEANLDDMTPELVPDAASAAQAAGALDVWTSGAQMKKGRPGFVISALVKPHDRDAVAASLLRHTSTLGVRMSRLERYELERDWISVDAGGGEVRVKRGWLAGELVNVAPEHDDCAAVAARTGQTAKQVWAAALGAASIGRGRE
jgi:pyridinium-3,5-bisthiocarboxylic acid mononucleotide nickel chelatase